MVCRKIYGYGALTHSEASKTVLVDATNLSGAANLNSFTGAAAYLMPKYSVTDVLFDAAWPTMVPLVVRTCCECTGPPTVEPSSVAATAAVRRRRCIFIKRRRWLCVCPVEMEGLVMLRYVSRPLDVQVQAAVRVPHGRRGSSASLISVAGKPHSLASSYRAQAVTRHTADAKS